MRHREKHCVIEERLRAAGVEFGNAERIRRSVEQSRRDWVERHLADAIAEAAGRLP